MFCFNCSYRQNRTKVQDLRFREIKQQFLNKMINFVVAKLK